MGLQLRADRDRVTQLELGYEKSLDGDTDRLTWRLDTRYSLDANHELRLGAAYQETVEISLSLQRSW